MNEWVYPGGLKTGCEAAAARGIDKGEDKISGWIARAGMRRGRKRRRKKKESIGFLVFFSFPQSSS